MLTSTTRNSHWRRSARNNLLKNFAKFTVKHLCQDLVFTKLAGLRPATLLHRRLWNGCFPVDVAKFLRAPFYRTLPSDCFCTKTTLCLTKHELIVTSYVFNPVPENVNKDKILDSYLTELISEQYKYICLNN